MNYLIIPLQEAPGTNWSFIFMMVGVIAVMYFLMIRPQQKKQKELVNFRSSLKKGDKVMTVGGVYGVIVEVKEQYVLIEVDSNVKIRFDKSAIAKDVTDIPDIK